MSTLSSTPTAESIANKLRSLQKNKKHLNQRVSLVQSGLQSLGLETKRL
jgi:chaperonin cofactor prefoldin